MLFSVDMLSIPTPGAPSDRPAVVVASYEIEASDAREAERIAMGRFRNEKPDVVGDLPTVIARARS